MNNLITTVQDKSMAPANASANVSVSKTIYQKNNLEQKPDTFEQSTPNRKQNNKKQKIIKWIIGGAIAIGSFFAVKSLIKSLKTSNINKTTKEKAQDSLKIFKPASKIKFKKAKNIEEAKEFARINFGTNLYLVDNLEIANYINKSLTIANNKMKGKLQLPTTISSQSDAVDEHVFAYASKIDDYGYILGINPSFVNSIKDQISSLCNDLGIQANTKIKFSTSKVMTDKYRKMFDKFIQGKSSFEENLRLYNILNALTSRPKDGFINDGITVPEIKKFGFSAIAHELMHIQRIKKAGEIIESAKLTDEQKAIASKVSSYAATDVEEFLCETFAGLMSGSKFSDDVINLYKKLGGEIFPDFTSKINPGLLNK